MAKLSSVTRGRNSYPQATEESKLPKFRKLDYSKAAKLHYTVDQSTGKE